MTMEKMQRYSAEDGWRRPWQCTQSTSSLAQAGTKCTVSVINAVRQRPLWHPIGAAAGRRCLPRRRAGLPSARGQPLDAFGQQHQTAAHVRVVDQGEGSREPQALAIREEAG